MTVALSVRLRRLAVNLGLMLATLVFLFFAAEVFLRVTRMEIINPRAVRLHRPSGIEGLVYEPLPNANTDGFGWEHITTNRLGFRSPERDSAKPVIAVIGDSYVFGHGVNDDETNPAYLQKEFPDHYVLNAGVDGYNIEQEALAYKAKIAQFDPRLVIVEFVFNDMQPKGYVNEDGTILVGQGPPKDKDKTLEAAITRKGLLNFPGKVFLEKNSAVFNFVERTTKWLPFRAKTVDTGDTVKPEELAFYDQWFTELDASIGDRPKVFVIWPESNWHEKSRQFLRGLATTRGYLVVDLYDSLGNGYMHLGWDYHPHPSVHQQVARIIAEAVRDAELLK
jgi:hypothetical protein